MNSTVKIVMLPIIAILINCNIIIFAEIKAELEQRGVNNKPAIEKVKTIQLDTIKNGLISFPRRIFMMNSGKYIIQDNIIKMYATDGKYIKNVGAIGEGKGEYHPNSELFTNGTIIGMYNRYKSMIQFYDENGSYIKGIYLKGGAYYSAVFYESNKIILLGYIMVKGEIKKYYMDCYDFDGSWLFRMGEYEPASPLTLGVGPLSNNFIQIKGDKLYLVMYDDILVKCYDIKSKRLEWKADLLPREIKAPFVSKKIVTAGRGELMKWDRERDCPLCLNICKSGLILVNTRFSTLVYSPQGKYVGFFKYNDPVSSFMYAKGDYLIGTLSPTDKKISVMATNFRVVQYEIKG